MNNLMFINIPNELAALCDVVSKTWQNGDNSINVEFSRHNENQLVIEFSGDSAVIKYSTPADAARGIGALLAGLVKDEQPYIESMPFEKLGIMLDCSRNAVMKVENVKKWLTQLALMGYNLVMLYTEDTYEIPGEPCFGYCRGAYSEAELKEIDAFAASLNMETIGCIQTLGHLEKLLRWPAYNNVKDTAAVMLADNEPTYELIDKMVTQIAKCISSRQIHVGMDETFNLGLGEYLRRNGYKPSSEIYNRHLGKVVEICEKHGLRPMIWSDMYFREGLIPGENYSPDKIISDEVKASIPADVDFVFWDYYKEQKDYYGKLIERHRELNKEPLIASGVWTWGRFWYDKAITHRTAGPCIEACRETGVKELFFTMWGDDGAYCEFDSALAGLAWCVEKTYSAEGKIDEQKLAKRFEAICGTSYQAVEKAAELNELTDVPALVWDDPILRANWDEAKNNGPDYWPGVLNKCEALLAELQPVTKTQQPVDFSYAVALLDFIKTRIELCMLLDSMDKDDATAAELCERAIAKMEKLMTAFRNQWLRRNKPEGMEFIQTRLAGLYERYKELQRTVSK